MLCLYLAYRSRKTRAQGCFASADATRALRPGLDQSCALDRTSYERHLTISPSLDGIAKEAIPLFKTPRHEWAAKGLVLLCGTLALTSLFSVLFYILIRGAGQLRLDFLLGRPNPLTGEYGILPGIINTLYIILLTLAVSAPVGIGAAVYLNEYAKPSKITRLINFTIGTLAGIPSVVYGLFGAVFFGETLRLGYSILAGSLTLSLLVLPIVIRTSRDALRTVPQSLREGALGCGASRWEMLCSIVLPSAGKGIAAAVLLAVGKIAAESAALLFTAGAASSLPKNWLTHPLSSGASLTVQMYLGVSGGKYIGEAFGIALALVLLLLGIRLLSAFLTGEGDS